MIYRMYPIGIEALKHEYQEFEKMEFSASLCGTHNFKTLYY